MKPLASLSSNYILVLIFVFGFIGEAFACNTKWIRLVYMMSCGEKKKRESVSVHNKTFFENLPGDFDGALKYFKDNDPYNPMFKNEALLYEILEEDEKEFRLNSRVPKLLLGNEVRMLSPKKKLRKSTTTTTTTTTARTSTTKKSSILLNKLFLRSDDTNHLGIPGFPDQWDIDDIVDEKINENHRRQLDQLIEECCKVPPVTTCNGNTFAGAC